MSDEGCKRTDSIKKSFSKDLVEVDKTHFLGGRSMYILPPSLVALSHQKNQTAVETDKFTKVRQRMAMFDSVCNWDGFYSESCLRFALEKHC